MKKQAMFERDILYPTQEPFEPGSAHIAVYAPKNSGSIPILIEAKTRHNTLDYIPDIIGILQTDIFDRIRIDIKKYGLLFFKAPENLTYNLVQYTDKDEYSVTEAVKIDLLL